MLLRLILSPRGALTTVWLPTSIVLLALLAFAALTACSDSMEQSDGDTAQSQESPAQPEQAGQASAAQSDAVEEEEAEEQSAAPESGQQSQDGEASAAQAMDRGQPEQQQQSDDYGSSDPYASDQDEAEDQAPAAPVAPIRQWLAEGVPLTPSVPAERDEYGWSAVIEGDVLAVSAPYHDVLGEDSGAVFVFERVDGEWVETAYILPPYPDPLGWFGRWLAIDDGRIVIGAPYEDGQRLDGTRIDDSGVAYVFEKVAGTWIRTGTLLPVEPHAGASFGWSVAISGDRIAVSAWEDPVEGIEAGSVTTYRQHKGLWQAEAVFRPSDPSPRQLFGRDIDLQDGVLVVGAPGDDTIAEDAGAVFVWHYYNDDWNFAGSSSRRTRSLATHSAPRLRFTASGWLRARTTMMTRCGAPARPTSGNSITSGSSTPSCRRPTCSRATGSAIQSISRTSGW